jgi:flagellar assembly protein FliH
MSVIKSTQSRPSFAGTSLYDLSDLRLGAEQALARARAEADRLVGDAKREVERVFSESRESGFEQGKAEGYATGLAEGRVAGEAAGRAEARAAHEALILALEQSISAEFGRWMSHRESVMRDAEREMAKIAILIAESVVRRQVTQDPAVVVRQVECAVALFARATRVAIEIAPEDEPMVRDAFPSLCAMLPADAEISLRARPGTSRGGCVVRSSEGTVDARIETQFRRIREGIIGQSEPIEPEIAAVAAATNGGAAPEATTAGSAVDEGAAQPPGDGATPRVDSNADIAPDAGGDADAGSDGSAA